MPYVQPLTSTQRQFVLSRFKQAIQPPIDVFEDGVSAIVRAQTTPEGRKVVRQLTEAAQEPDIDRIGLLVEIYSKRLKELREQRQDDFDKMAVQSEQDAISRDIRKQAKRDVKRKAVKAQKRAGRHAASPAETHDRAETA